MEQITNPFPEGSGPATVALLTDGRVLCSGPETSHNWYTLTPDTFGDYANGSWRQVGSTQLGRAFAPSYVMKDGRFIICGGEYVDPVDPQPYGDRSACEIFDPRTNLWSSVSAEMPNADMIADTPTAELADGQIFMLSYPQSGTNYAAYVFNPYNTSTWTSAGFYDPSLSNSEGVSLLLRDGSVLTGDLGFQRYLPFTNSWTNAAFPPTSLTSNPDPTGQGEIGPALMLYDGSALVLGGNSKNAIYSPDLHDWTLIADTPIGPDPATPYSHSDAPGTVEPDGRVLAVVTNDSDGQGTSVFYEYDRGTNTWTPVTAPDTFGTGNRTRLLNLPRSNQATGQVLVAGTLSQNVWLYTPSGTPQASWTPTIQSISGPIAGEYTLAGTQLNGLTTGADLGDDAKMATNYPIISLVSSSGSIFSRVRMISIKWRHEWVLQDPASSR